MNIVDVLWISCGVLNDAMWMSCGSCGDVFWMSWGCRVCVRCGKVARWVSGWVGWVGVWVGVLVGFLVFGLFCFCFGVVWLCSLE